MVGWIPRPTHIAAVERSRGGNNVRPSFPYVDGTRSLSTQVMPKVTYDRKCGSNWDLRDGEGVGKKGQRRRTGVSAPHDHCLLLLPTHLAHAVKDNCAVTVHALRAPLQGSGQDCS